MTLVATRGAPWDGFDVLPPDNPLAANGTCKLPHGEDGAERKGAE